MTNKRDLKALVRERMEKTGETYMQAKAEVQKTVFGSEPTHVFSENKKARLECIFCSEEFETLAELKSHSVDCDEHPAVQETKRLHAIDRLTASELRMKVEALDADIQVNGVDENDLIDVRGFGGKVPRKVAEHLEMKKLLARAEGREERAAAIKVNSKLAPTDAMKKALTAWGVTVMDGMLIGPDGVPLKAKWSSEPANEMAMFSKDAEVQLAATVMTEVFTSLMGKDEPRELNALELGAALRQREKAFAAGYDPDNERNFFVWEAEYKEDGCVEIYAANAEEAKAKYRKETGVEDEVELEALPVTPENDKIAPKYRSARSWTDLKREMYKDRPEALEKIERLVDKDIAEMLGSEKKFRIGDVDFPIGSLTQAGRIKSITEDYYTKLPCGHFVLNPDSEAARLSVKELSEKFGIDAQAELKAMIDEELARHEESKCLLHDWREAVRRSPTVDELPDWREIANQSPTPEQQKAYVDSIEGGTDATMLRRLPSPFGPSKRRELTEAEWKERALLADPAELKKFIGDPTARVVPLTYEEEQRVALTVSGMTSPKTPIPTNVELKLPSTGPVQEVGYLDDETFALVKMEKYPCGHGLRKSTEVPIDLKAVYGDAGVEAWDRILEQERQKHLDGKCSEASSDFKLVPRVAPNRHITVVLMNDKGEYLYPPDAASYELPPSLVVVIVNGEAKEVQGPVASYDELLWQAGLPSEATATITYRAEGFPGGTLIRGQRLELLPGMIFNVVETSSA